MNYIATPRTTVVAIPSNPDAPTKKPLLGETMTFAEVAERERRAYAKKWNIKTPRSAPKVQTGPQRRTVAYRIKREIEKSGPDTITGLSEKMGLKYDSVKKGLGRLGDFQLVDSRMESKPRRKVWFVIGEFEEHVSHAHRVRQVLTKPMTAAQVSEKLGGGFHVKQCLIDMRGYGQVRVVGTDGNSNIYEITDKGLEMLD